MIKSDYAMEKMKLSDFVAKKIGDNKIDITQRKQLSRYYKE